MADQNNSGSNPAEQAARALGGMVEGEHPPFPSDDSTTDQSDDIASIFGLGEEAGPVPNSSKGSSDGGASPSGANPAAEGGGEQAREPATPPAQQQQEPGQQGDQSQAPAQQAPQPAPAAPATDQQPGQQQAPEAASVQALQAQVQALIAQNTQLLQRISQPQGAGNQAPQPTGPSGQQGQQQDADPYMDYRFALPDEVANAIFDEDPQRARQGMTHLINSIMRLTHERVLRSVTERVLPQTLNEFQGNLNLTQQQQQMREEYFRNYPQHNDPGIRLIVAQEAEAMWSQNPSLEWNETARNALGQRVNARLGLNSTPQQQQPQQQQGQNPAQAQPAPRPAAQMGASNRPPVNPADNDGNFISDVLSAG